MEGVKLASSAAVAVPNLMGSEGLGGVRVNGVGDAEGCDAGRVLVFGGPKIEKSSALVSQRDSEYNVNALESYSSIKKADTESRRKTIQLSPLSKEGIPHELDVSVGNSVVLASGSEGKQLLKKGGRVPRCSPGCSKTPRTQLLERSMLTVEDADIKDASDELGSRITKSSHTEKFQPLKHRNNLHCKRGDRKNSRVPLKTKHDGVAGFSPASGGNKVFGTYGLKPDVHDISKLTDDISLNELLDGSYKYSTVAKEKGRRPANTSENILHSVRKAFSILQPQGLSRVNKQFEEMDTAFRKESSSLSTSNMCIASNLDDEESSPSSDLSCTKVQESCVDAEAPSGTCDLPLYHPRDIIQKFKLPAPKDLDSLLLDATKPATFSRSNDPRRGKPVSHQVTLSSFSWSHNYNGHGKSNSDSVKVSSRSSCQGRWVRIGKTASFFGGGSESFVDLDSLTYDHSLIPSGSVKYILPETAKISNRVVREQASFSVVCPTSSQSPPALHSPRAMAAAEALYDIAKSSSKQTSNGIIKWPKQPSQRAMKARKSKSILNSENLSTPKSEMMLDNTIRFVDHAKPLKKPKLLISEKRDHSDHATGPRAPYLLSAPRSSRSSPIRASRESAPDASNRHHMNGNFPKPIFMAPPRRVSDKPNHRQPKLKKVLQMDWSRG